MGDCPDPGAPVTSDEGPVPDQRAHAIVHLFEYARKGSLSDSPAGEGGCPYLSGRRSPLQSRWVRRRPSACCPERRRRRAPSLAPVGDGKEILTGELGDASFYLEQDVRDQYSTVSARDGEYDDDAPIDC